MTVPAISAKHFIDRLVAAVPEFAEAYKEELEEIANGLPYVVAGFLTTFIVDEYKQGRTATDSPFTRALFFLEEAITADDAEVQNIVETGVLENLHIAQDSLDGITAKMGNALKTALANLRW